jgi:hypothetical protein
MASRQAICIGAIAFWVSLSRIITTLTWAATRSLDQWVISQFGDPAFTVHHSLLFQPRFSPSFMAVPEKE